MNPGLLASRPVNFLLHRPLLPTDHPLACQDHRPVPGSYVFLDGLGTSCGIFVGHRPLGFLRTPLLPRFSRNGKTKAKDPRQWHPATSLDQSSISETGSLGYLGMPSAESAVGATSVTAEFDPCFDSALRPWRPSPARPSALPSDAYRLYPCRRPLVSLPSNSLSLIWAGNYA